jgi:hypothetical protein
VANHLWRGNFRYEPLLAAGVPAVVHLVGTNTLRLTLNGTAPFQDRLVEINYLLFVPFVPPPVTIINPHFEGANFVLSFQSQTGKTYAVESSSDLNSWGNAGVAPMPGNNALLTIPIPPQSAVRTFYRVLTQ